MRANGLYHVIAAGLVALLVQLASPARAGDSPDPAAVQALISGQIEAFRADDAESAYGFASPMAQARFASPQSFFDMVVKRYRPVYRPRSVRFGTLQALGANDLAQEVILVDDEGVSWAAIYTIEKQPDGTLKISGCSLMRLPDQQARLDRDPGAASLRISVDRLARRDVQELLTES